MSGCRHQWAEVDRHPSQVPVCGSMSWLNQNPHLVAILALGGFVKSAIAPAGVGKPYP